MPYAPRVYLTGFMGSGKSTVGPILANVLGYRFLDLDAEIARAAGMPVQEIFRTQGEAAFRKIERETLQATGRREEVVVSLGGGALVQEENLRWALGHGLVVYLRVSPEILVERLLRSPTPRPLLYGEDGQRLSREPLRARIFALLEAREPFYRRAHFVVETSSSLGETVDAVVRAIRSRQAK